VTQQANAKTTMHKREDVSQTDAKNERGMKEEKDTIPTEGN
jgi:hypothetical protein